MVETEDVVDWWGDEAGTNKADVPKLVLRTKVSRR